MAWGEFQELLAKNPLTPCTIPQTAAPSIGVRRAGPGPESRLRLCFLSILSLSHLEVGHSQPPVSGPFSERSPLPETLLLKFHIVTRLLLQRIGPDCPFGPFDRASDPVFVFSRCCTPGSSKQQKPQTQPACQQI